MPRPATLARATAALLLAGATVLATLGACGRDAEDDAPSDGRASLPPGLAGRAPTNADVAPPAVPFSAATPVDTVRPVASWPHDAEAFTQGLLVHEGRLLESTGLTGRSQVRDVDRATGRVRLSHELPRHHFGEGIATVDSKLYQVTWRAGQGYVYDLATLAPIDSFNYAGEGWGLASDGAALYLSDGSADIRVLDPTTGRVQRTIAVTDGGRRVHALNELEWIEGALWANVYQTDWVARIDPASGRVLRWAWIGGLLSPTERRQVVARGGVANGIAFDDAERRVLFTGKYWPRLYAFALPR